MTLIKHEKEWYVMQEIKGEIVLVPADGDRAYEVKNKTLDVRSVKTNAAMHKYFSLVSNSLNHGGFTIQKVVALFKKAGIEWSMLAVKEVIWRNVQIAVTGKKSTAKLEQHEVTKVYKNVDFYLTSTVGIESIDFPSIESMIFRQNYKGDKK